MVRPFLLALWALPAYGWPVDFYVDVNPGREHFARVSRVDWVEVEDGGIVSAEYLESGELLFSAKSPGRTLVAAYADGRLLLFRVRVGTEAQRGDVALAKKACPKLDAGPPLTALVVSEGCRRELLSLFQGDGYAAKDLALTVELPVLQAQLVALSARLGQVAPGVSASYRGAGLVLKGKATRAQHRQALWEAFKASVGGLALEDRIEEAREP